MAEQENTRPTLLMNTAQRDLAQAISKLCDEYVLSGAGTLLDTIGVLHSHAHHMTARLFRLMAAPRPVQQGPQIVMPHPADSAALAAERRHTDD